MSQHVVNRGANRSAVFRAPSDYAVFLNLLQVAARVSRVSIHAYALMSNHIHLLVTPASEQSLALMMQDVGRNYAPFFNRRYGRTGTLWEGRYRAAVLTTDDYWLTCLRYVELNPVRAGLVSAPEDYRWSSYRAHAFGADNPLLAAHQLFESLGATSATRQQAWRSACQAPLPDDKLAELRQLLWTGRGPGNVAALEVPDGSDPALTPDLLGF